MIDGSARRRGGAHRASRPSTLLWVVALLCTACERGPAGPDGSLLVDAAGPALQLTAPSSSPPDPLRVAVRRSSDLAPAVDAEVRWEVVEGSGLVLSAASTRTDSAGLATTVATLGNERGRYRVRARVGESAFDFELWAVDAPVLDSMPTAARPGDTIRLLGRNFSPVAAQHVIQIAGVRARVVGADATLLSVEVPPCLPDGAATLRVVLGNQQSPARTLQISPGGATAALPVGGAVTLDGGEVGAAACRRLPAGTYLLVLGATGAVAGAREAVALRTIPGASPSSPAAVAPVLPPSSSTDEAVTVAQESLPARWDALLREREMELLSVPKRPLGRQGTAPTASARKGPPLAGDRREFNVIQPGGQFRRVSAVARRVGARLALYEDAETPPDQLTPADYADFEAAFEDPIAPTITDAFGMPTDVDENQRIAVLFTPAVNRLTERESTDGFIGGFFFGLDLLPDRADSNGGEVLYALVPDPNGRFGDPRSRDLVRAAVPNILAHEFVHMVNFGQRVVERGAPGSETVWLAEGLAEMGEDRVADAYAARGDTARAATFRSGNALRARLFLADAPGTSLITSAGKATLAERGASWLFLRYVTDQYGGDALLRRLTQTTRTGTENVAGATGRAWASLLLDWAVAVYDGDETGITDPLAADPRYRYRPLRPRETLALAGQSYPLGIVELDSRRTTIATELLDGVVAHHHFVARAPFTVSVSGGGVASPPSPGITLRVVRLR